MSVITACPLVRNLWSIKQMSIEFSASQQQARETLLPTSTILRPHLYGLGYPRQPFPFIEHLYL